MILFTTFFHDALEIRVAYSELSKFSTMNNNFVARIYIREGKKYITRLCVITRRGRDVIVVHYVCRGLFDERFAVTNGLDPPSYNHLLSRDAPISTIPTHKCPPRPRFIMRELLRVCETRSAERAEKEELLSDRKRLFFEWKKFTSPNISP